MRLGTADLEGIHFDGGIERRIKEIRYHPRYRPGRVYFDVGVATANKLITFTEYVRPVCLPYLPVDFEDSLKDKFVTLAGWGYTIQARTGAELSVELTSNLKLRSLKVISVLSCDRFEYKYIKTYKCSKIRTHIYFSSSHFQVQGRDQCEDFFSTDSFDEAGVNVTVREQSIPFGFTSENHRDLACVDHNDDDLPRVTF